MLFRSLGDSRRLHLWLWDDVSFINNIVDAKIKGYMEEGGFQLFLQGACANVIAAVRVHWFHSSARCARWTEELALLEEEMRRTVRFFLFERRRWLRRAAEEDQDGEHGYASYARRYVR